MIAVPFLLNEGNALLQVEPVMPLTDPDTEIIRQRRNEHLSEMDVVEASAVHVSLPYPFTHMCINVFHVLAHREGMNIPKAVHATLLSPAFILVE